MRQDIVQRQQQAATRLREIEHELDRLLIAMAKGHYDELAMQKLSDLKQEHMNLQRSIAALEKIAGE